MGVQVKMSASICPDTFTIMIVVTVDCDLDITSPDPTFVLQPGNEQTITVAFTFRVGSGYNLSHTNYGFTAELGALSTPNAASMSLNIGPFNPPSPVPSDNPREIQDGTLLVYASAAGNIDAMAADQNVQGTVTINTGV